MDYVTFKSKLGKRIKHMRVERGLTQEDMDEGDEGIPYRTIQNIETGKSNPNLRTLFRLSKRFKVPVGDLFNL